MTDYTETWPSGLRRTLGKRVYSNVSGVRIPSSLQRRLLERGVFSVLNRIETCFRESDRTEKILV